MIKIEDTAGGAEFEVKAVPASSRTQIAGEYGGRLKVNIAAPPEKGKANKTLVRFLAETLALRKNDITIIRGQTSAVKRIRVSGLSAKSLAEKIEQVKGQR
jgi:hypothetical protein